MPCACSPATGLFRCMRAARRGGRGRRAQGGRYERRPGNRQPGGHLDVSRFHRRSRSVERFRPAGCRARGHRYNDPGGQRADARTLPARHVAARARDFMTWLADIVLVVHALLVLFIVGGLAAIWTGAALGWRWVRARTFRLAHLLAIGIVAALAALGIDCPLTVLEDRLRRVSCSAGSAGCCTMTCLHGRSRSRTCCSRCSCGSRGGGFPRATSDRSLGGLARFGPGESPRASVGR